MSFARDARRMNRVVATFSVLSLLGCSSQAARPPARVASLAPAIERAPSATPPPDGVRIRIRSHDATLGRVVVTVRLEGAARATSLAFTPSHPAALEGLVVSDEAGAVPTTVSAVDGGTRVDLARPPSGAVTLGYEVALSAKPLDATARPDPTEPFAEPTELRVGGDDVLLLPASSAPYDVTLDLGTGGGEARAASSFGLGTAERAHTTSDELRRAFFVAGDLVTALLHADDGDDVASAVGYTSFDPRWVGAEIAGVRTGVDQALGLVPGSPSSATPFSIQIVSKRHTAAPIALSRRARGLVISVDPGAAWTPEARIDVAQRLVQRFVGGRLWIGDRGDEARGWFFSEGFSRALASQILFDMGMLTPADRAAEVDALLATIALSPLGHASLDALAKDGSPEAVRVSAARGALAALELDLALRDHPQGSARSLEAFTRELLRAAAEERVDAMPLARFLDEVTRAAGSDVGQNVASVLARGSDVVLPSGGLGRCYRWVSRDLAPFDLGLSVENLTVKAVAPGSRAEAAGVAVGDHVVTLEYRDGSSRVPVRLTYERRGETRAVTYLPAGRSLSAHLFERVPGTTDEACAPR